MTEMPTASTPTSLSIATTIMRIQITLAVVVAEWLREHPRQSLAGRAIGGRTTKARLEAAPDGGRGEALIGKLWAFSLLAHSISSLPFSLLMNFFAPCSGPNAAEGGEGSHAATAAPTATAPPAPTVAGASSTSASSTMAAAPTAIPPAPISSATAHPPRSYASSAAAPSTNPPPAAPASAPSMQGWTRVSNPFSKNT